VTTPATVYGAMVTGDWALRLARLLAGSSLHRFRYPRRNSVRRERLVYGRNNSIAFPRLERLYAMTSLVFPAASTGAWCVSDYDFHGFPPRWHYGRQPSFRRIRNRVWLPAWSEVECP